LKDSEAKQASELTLQMSKLLKDIKTTNQMFSAKLSLVEQIPA